MGSLDIIGLVTSLLKELGPLKEILLQVLDGDYSQLSSEGSLAGSGAAQEAAGSVVGSTVGSLGGEVLVNKIPTDYGEALSSMESLGISPADLLG